MLIDTDKSINRANPLPSSHDVLPPGAVTAKGTNSVNYVTPATNQSLIAAGRNGQFTIVKADSFVWNGGDFSPGNVPGAFYNGEITMGTIPHGLNFTPGVVAYLDNGSFGKTFLPAIDFAAVVGRGIWDTFRVAADATNVYFYVDVMTVGQGTGYGVDWQFKYYLLQQTSNA